MNNIIDNKSYFYPVSECFRERISSASPEISAPGEADESTSHRIPQLDPT